MHRLRKAAGQSRISLAGTDFGTTLALTLARGNASNGRMRNTRHLTLDLPSSLWHSACAQLSEIASDCTVDTPRSAFEFAMDQQDDVSDTESEAYVGDEAGNVNQQDQEVADLQGAEAGMLSSYGTSDVDAHRSMLAGVLRFESHL